ncbi:MAG: hypothetical protein WC806_02775 [Candidatus Gracilibacteria bacterium]|jgi:hypothetical protein
MDIESENYEEGLNAQIKELEFRAKYYLKGFGSLLLSLQGNIFNFTQGADKENSKQRIEKDMDEIVTIYAKLSIEESQGHPDSDIFIVIKGKIIDLKNEIGNILNGKSDSKAKEIMSEIFDKGYEYRKRLEKLQESIRQHQGFESFCMAGTDITGRLWKNLF